MGVISLGGGNARILLLQQGGSGVPEGLEAVAGTGEVQVISVPPNERRSVAANGRAASTRGSARAFQSGRRAGTIGSWVRELPVAAPLFRLIDQARVEVQGMQPTPVDPPPEDTRVDAVIEALDSNRDAIVVCGDSSVQRLGWRIAQRRPDRVVLASPESAIAVLSLADAADAPRTPDGVRAVLGGASPVGTYPFPELRRASRPRVVSLVSNKVQGDSRVQKVAASLADFGYESLLIGRHPDGGRDHYMQGGALVVRLPVPLRSKEYERDSPPRTPLTAVAFRSQSQVVAARRKARARARRLSATPPHRAVPLAFRVESARQWGTALRIGLHGKNRGRFFSLRGDESIETAGAWRRPCTGPFEHWAVADDFELGYGPYLESLQPDVIHAHDADMLSVAVVAAKRLRAVGHEVRVVYDAHEYTPGTARFHARQSDVLAAVERRYIAECDAVITVSDEISDLLTTEHSLVSRPVVVTNAPTATAGTEVVGIRQRLGLSDSVPILVYVGGVAPQRGVDLAVAALPSLPDAHLVVVAPATGQSEKLAALAGGLGVLERVHRLDYVAADQVVAFIRSCDVGLIPFRPLPNSELGLPTKYREYLVAGLPIVASDQGLVGREVRRTGVGTLFAPGDADDLARAITDLLAASDTYRARITKELTTDLMWEGQAEVLKGVYSRLALPGEELPPTQGATHPAVLIGRTNMAGQATAWARSLREAGVEATSLQVVSPSNEFDFQADVSVRREDWDRRGYRLRAFVDLVPRHTHALVEFGIALLDNTGEPMGDLGSLTQSGLVVGLVFHGSDVRRPGRHAEREPWSPFRDPANAVLTQKLRERTARLHEALASYEGPSFVSTPDLLDDVPFGHWLPVVVDTNAFRPDGRNLEQRDRPVVVHAPSRGAMKGTRYIDPVLRRLDVEGVIRYRPITGLPHALMPSVMAASDIVVDQVLLNAVGVAAAEAMASGRVVVAHLDERMASRYPHRPPVVDATPANIEGVVRDLAADAARRAELGRSGRAFSLQVHDGRMSARVLGAGLGLDLPNAD